MLCIMSRLKERIENFNNSFKLFSQAQAAFSNDKDSDINRLALIQAFEIVYELGWKVLKDYLSNKGIETFTPKDTIKAAFSANILPAAQIWIDMADDRNVSSHEYNSDKINILLEKISSTYFDELKKFSENLGGLYD